MDESKLKQLDDLIERARLDWKIPGMSVSLVQNGEIISAKGYGTRTLGGAPVDGDSLYSIGSCSKSFTAAALALLVDEGKLTWDDPVIQHLPDFALPDPWVTQHVTVRDLLAHRLGLKRATMTYFYGYDNRELMRRMRYYDTLAEFRSEFIYDNAQYTTAGVLVEAISGVPWGEFVHKRLFKPLGMARSQTSWSEVAPMDNIAGGHVVKTNASVMIGDVAEVPWQDIGHEPAGSVASSANDLAHWLIMLLNGGTSNSQQIISPKTLADLHSPQVVSIHVEQSPFAPMHMMQSPTHFWTYGLGFYLIDYRGFKMVIGGGQIRGHNSLFVLFPHLNAGYAILANVTNTVAHMALSNSIADLLLGETGSDWNGNALALAKQFDAQAEDGLDGLLASKTSDAPSQPLETLFGSYRSNLFGDVIVGAAGIRYGRGYVGTLEAFGGDRYLARWDDLALSPSLIIFSGSSMTFGEIGMFERV